MNIPFYHFHESSDSGEEYFAISGKLYKSKKACLLTEQAFLIICVLVQHLFIGSVIIIYIYANPFNIP